MYRGPESSAMYQYAYEAGVFIWHRNWGWVCLEFNLCGCVCTNIGVGMGWYLVLYGRMMNEGWNCKDVFLHSVLIQRRKSILIPSCRPLSSGVLLLCSSQLSGI
jgi:hypothetical protein